MCSSSYTLHLFLILKIVFRLITLFLPVLIMYKAFSAFFRSLISADLSKNILPLAKNFVAALIIFFLPSVFSFIFIDLFEATDIDVIQCFNDATLEKIESLREEEKIREKEELKDQNKLKADELNKQREIQKKKNEEKKKFNEEIKKKKEAEAANNGGGGNSSPGSSNNNLSSADVNIYIGDSRTVGLCITMTGDSAGCSYSAGGAKYNDSDIYIAQGSMSYSWFNSTAVPAVNNIISSYDNVKFNIYSMMGVNMLLYDIDKYISSYNSLASGSWKNHNVILVSVNPVDENIERQHGYSTKNSDIVTFNTKLKNGVSGNNVKYCDTYSSLINNIVTTDGLHYGSSTYQSIYSKINACGG